MSPLICPKCRAELDLEYALSLTVRPAPDEPWRRIPLKELELSVRAYNALDCSTWNGTAWVKDGPQTAGEIDDKTDAELLRFCNFGRKSLREVREQIARVKAEQEPHR